MSNAQDLISESTEKNTIIHAEYSEELATDLLIECEDNVDTPETAEFWGEDWRVILDKAA